MPLEKGQTTKTNVRRRGGGRNAPTEPAVKVKWITWTTTPPDTFGHGVGLYDVQIKGRHESLVAFLDGFAWLHGDSNQAVIHCIRPNVITTAQVLDAMKKRIEEILARRQLPNNRITRRIIALVNG